MPIKNTKDGLEITIESMDDISLLEDEKFIGFLSREIDKRIKEFEK